METKVYINNGKITKSWPNAAWTGTHLDRPFWSVHGFSQVSSGSAGSRPWPASSSLRGPSPQALTLLGGAGFITWRLRHPFLGERRRGPRHFWSRRACLGYGPAPGPTEKKKPWAILVRLVRRPTNIDLKQPF